MKKQKEYSRNIDKFEIIITNSRTFDIQNEQENLKNQ
jgi:hypothetical protein